MMASLWSDIEADLVSARRHFGQAMTLFDDELAASSGVLDYRASMAFQHAMLAGYTSLENALKRLLALLDEPLPVGPDSHAALISRLSRPLGKRPALFDSQMSTQVSHLRRFRHVALHSYDHFDVELAAPAVRAAKIFLADSEQVFRAFIAVVDPD